MRSFARYWASLVELLKLTRVRQKWCKTHIRVHIHVCARIHTYTHVNARAHANMHAQGHVCTQTYTHVHAHTRACADARTYRYVHACAHARMHTKIHQKHLIAAMTFLYTYLYMYMYTCILFRITQTHAYAYIHQCVHTCTHAHRPLNPNMYAWLNACLNILTYARAWMHSHNNLHIDICKHTHKVLPNAHACLHDLEHMHNSPSPALVKEKTLECIIHYVFIINYLDSISIN